MGGGIGAELRAARERQRLTLSDAARATCIREGQLAALEAEDFAQAGQPVYVRGFIRAYARFLGLDPEPIVARYRTATADPDEVELSRIATVAAPERSRLERLVGTATAIVLVAGALVAVGGDSSPSTRPLAAPAPPPALASTLQDVPEEEAAVDPEPAGVTVEVRVQDSPAWLRVLVDGALHVEQIHPPGSALLLEAAEEVLIRTGNAAAVQVVVNGQDQGPLGGAGQVVERSYRAAAGS